MGEIRDNIQKNLGYYLTLRGMSQKDFADALGVSQSAVTCWIKGKNSPDIETISKICDLLNISVVELFGTNGIEFISDDQFCENAILEGFRKLNHKGKDKVLDYICDLNNSGIYSVNLSGPSSKNA